MDKIKVLVVDDEPDFLKLMEARIKEWGYGFIGAPGGRDALAAIKSDKPDIVILDYMMPQMDGLEVLSRIRKTDKGLCVIMFTAYPDGRAMKEAVDFDVFSFIPKLSVYVDTDAILKSALAMAEKKLAKRGQNDKG